MDNIIRPIHPSEIVLEEFLKPLNMTNEQLAEAIKMPTEEVNNFLINRANFTTDFISRLGIYFKMGTDFFYNLQRHYELDLLHLNKPFQKDKMKIIPITYKQKNNSLRA